MPETPSAQDPRDQLSLAAQGVLALLERHPELPSASKTAVGAYTSSGTTNANSALTELVRAGFLLRWQQRRRGATPGFDYRWELYPNGDAPSPG